MPNYAPPALPAPETHDMDVGPPQGPDAPYITWDNRRRMAWLSFYVLIAGSVVAVWAGLFMAKNDRQIALIEDVYSYLAIATSAVILGGHHDFALPGQREALNGANRARAWPGGAPQGLECVPGRRP